MIDDKTLKFYSRQGLIPGPGESEEEFLQRARYCLDIKALAPEGQPLPKQSAAEEELAQEVLREAHALTAPLFGTAPEWVPLYFSNHKLAPWHGGCAWIYQLNKETPATALFQLRKAFRRKKKSFGYRRDEIVAHELGHVGRMRFQEPKFEEMLCYRTARSRFRRWFGPIVQSAGESALFAFILILIIVGDLFVILFGNETLFAAMSWLKLVPLAMIVYGLVRLKGRHRLLDSCLSTLEQALENPEEAGAVAYRLTDREIPLFAKSPPEKLLRYVEEKSKKSLRWKQITLVYNFSLPS